MKRTRFLTLVVLCACAAAPVAAQTFRAGASVTIDGAGDGVVAAGAAVAVSGEVRAGLAGFAGVVAAGGAVTITADVAGGVLAAGGEVLVSGSASDVHAAGGSVEFRGTARDEVALAGGNIVVADTASIAADLHAAGGSVKAAGKIGGDAQLSGAYVEFNGETGGDLTLAGEELVIGAGAIINGDLVYYGTKTANISPDAQIRGDIKFEQRTRRDLQRDVERMKPFPQRSASARAFGALFWFVVLAASGALLATAFPAWFDAAARAGRDHPLSTAGVGILALLGVPVIAVLLMLIAIGLPAGAFLLALYAGLLALSLIGAGLGVGHLALDRSGGDRARLVALAAGLAIVLVAGAAPAIGGLALFLSMIFGLGVLLRGLYAALRGAPGDAG